MDETPQSVIAAAQQALMFLDNLELRDAVAAVELHEVHLARARRQLVDVRRRREELARWLREHGAA